MPFKNLETRREWHHKNRDKAKQYQERWKEGEAGKRWIENQRKAAEKRKEAREKLRAEKAEWQKQNRDLIRKEENSKHREYRKRKRLLAIEKMGGCCEVCGIDDPDVLQFDHVEPLLNSINNHKKKSRSGSANEIVKMEDPRSVFQCLCANCHVKKTRMNDEYGITRLSGED